MGEYARLNKMIEDLENEKAERIAGGDIEGAFECDNEIGEVKGALLEMAEMDGLEDWNEAFDYVAYEADYAEDDMNEGTYSRYGYRWR